jgi:hypothetical protein
MEGEQKRAAWKIWVYLTPVYVLLAIPLVKWTQRINSSDVKLDKDEYNAFNAQDGEIKKTPGDPDYDPGLNDSGYSVRYRSGGAAADEERRVEERTEAKRREVAEEKAADERRQAAAQGEYRARTGGQAALESADTNNKTQMSVGAQKGYLTTAVGKVMNNPKAVGALLNNKYVVGGFMSRGTVKAATASPEALANYLKGPGPMNFLNNPVVKAAMNNPAIVSAVAGSAMVSAFLETPAAKGLMNNPDALAAMVQNNPQLVNLAMQNPQTMTMLMANPDVSGIVNKFDTSKIKTGY